MGRPMHTRRQYVRWHPGVLAGDVRRPVSTRTMTRPRDADVAPVQGNAYLLGGAAAACLLLLAAFVAFSFSRGGGTRA